MSNKTCKNGICTCNANYYGTDCSKFCDPSKTCNNNGKCDDNGNCICDGEYTDNNCSSPISKLPKLSIYIIIPIVIILVILVFIIIRNLLNKKRSNYFHNLAMDEFNALESISHNKY
jgi:hypothetical protein